MTRWIPMTILAVGVAGCGSPPPTCGPAPAEPVVGFVVTTVTGGEATDMDIMFCYRTKQASDFACMAMDNPGNDFESGQTDVFTLSVSPIAVGDLAAFKIYNSGGGFLEKSWDLASLEIKAILESGDQVLLYDQPDVNENLWEGESFEAAGCEY